MNEKLTGSKAVDDHIAKMNGEIAAPVNMIRKIILGTDPEIQEHIKWNSPSFYYAGEMRSFNAKEYKRDIAVLNLHRGRLMLVFPTGESVKDVSSILEGTYTDGRRIITFNGVEDVVSKEAELQKIIRAWLKLIER